MKIKQWFEFIALLLFGGGAGHKYLEETKNHKLDEFLCEKEGMRMR